MSIDDVIFLGRDAMLVTFLVAAPMLLSGMLIGLIISIFQSVTQIQEITLTFVPKIMVVFLAFVLSLPFIMAVMIDFTTPLIGNVHEIIR